MTVRNAIVYSMILILAAVAGLAAADAAERPVVIKKLFSMPLAESCAGELAVGAEKVRFFPQSLAVRDGIIYAVNRHEPLVAKFAADGKPLGIIRLKHPDDKKFDARFFIDIILDEKAMYLLEQSTATLRVADMAGRIDDFYMTTSKEGAIVARAWKTGASKFLVYDRGLANAYVRDISNPEIRKDPDRSGTEFVCEADSLMCAGEKLVMLENKKGTFEAYLTKAAPGDDITPMASWSGAENVIALDTDGGGRYYFYVMRKIGCSIDEAAETNGKFAVRSFPCEKLEFFDEATRHAAAAGPGKLVLLYGDGKSAHIGEISLETTAGK